MKKGNAILVGLLLCFFLESVIYTLLKYGNSPIVLLQLTVDHVTYFS